MLTKDFPDYGDEFWAMFPHDDDGNVCLDMSEIDPDDFPDLEPDPEIVSRIKDTASTAA